MKKIDLGQTVQVLANIGVIAGIVFLALELRQTSNALLGATYQARALSMQDRQEQLANSEYILPAILRLEEGSWDTISAEDRRRIGAYNDGAFYRIDGMFYQYELGLLGNEYYESVFDGEMRLWVPRWRDEGSLDRLERWGYIRPAFAREIQRYLDAPPLN